MQPPRLFTYFRSGSSHRVRIALALKDISYEAVPIHLLRDGGEHRRPDYLALNPQGRLPCMVLEDGDVLIQSPAILEYLEEVVPTPPLLPADPVLRAKVRSVAALIGCDIHPLNNVAVLTALRADLGVSDAAVGAWIGRWISQGLAAVEALIGDHGYCFGWEPGMADVYLLPQLFSARRFGVPLDALPKVRRVEALAKDHPAFAAASPERQPDAA